VGAPVFDETGACVAGISVTGPSFRLPRSLGRLGELCRLGAAEVTERLGGGEAVIRNIDVASASNQTQRGLRPARR
jgi:hypothetical protein